MSTTDVPPKPNRNWGWGDRLTRFFRIGKILPFIRHGERVVDIGCGQSNAVMAAVESRGGSYVGVDPLVEKEGMRGAAEFVRHIVGDGGRIPLPDTSFDVAISLAVLEHVDDPLGLIAEKFRLLKPGGRLILTTPTRFAKPVLEALVVLHIINKQEIAEHKHYFNRAELRDLVTRAGFSDFKHETWQLLMNQLVTAKKPPVGTGQ